MKKLLVVLLALVMVIAMATSAMAFTDTDDLNTVEQDAIYRLYALGVLNGYSDGSFGADNQITRAEFAKIACIVAGFGDVSDLMANTPSSFTDVAVGMWYTGYVNVAASQGFVHGYPDGTFRPNDPITMAEVVTVLMRIAGYNDNLPGPWPFDYIAQAGKEDVTDDVTFVSSAAATRSAVAVMVNNLLDVDIVNYDNDISDFVDDEDEGSVLESSFEAKVYDDIVFNNDDETPDAVDCWYYSDFDEKEITLYFAQYTEVYYHDEDYDVDYPGFNEYGLVMNEDCYISGGNTLTNLSGMQADIITNDDDEVIYVHIVSSVVYSDDVEGSVLDDDVKVNDDSVNAVNNPYAFSEWFDSDEYDGTVSGYAKVFYNDDGDVYAISDLNDADEFGYYWMDVFVADSYDEDDEELGVLASTYYDSVDLSGDFVVLKDGKDIEASEIEQMDVVDVYYIGDYWTMSENDYMVLVVDSWTEGNLDEATHNGGDNGTITVGDNDYQYVFEDNSAFGSYINTEGGVDGDYNELDDILDLDDVYGENIMLATYPNPYAIAFLVTDIDVSSKVYGVVTDLTVGGLFHNVTDVTILNQEGEEVTYDLDDDDIITYYDASDIDDSPLPTDVELGSYVEVKTDEDGVITSVCKDDYDELIIYDVDETTIPSEAMTVSGSKIKIGGTWYKITDNTLFFETVPDEDVYTDLAHYDSAQFDAANLISVDDILDADDIGAEGYIIASNDGGTLERLFMVESDISAGDEGYSFVERMYTNSSGDFMEMMDGTIAERKESVDYAYNTFYSYDIVNGEFDIHIEEDVIFSTYDDYDDPSYSSVPFEDGYWVLYDGHLDMDNSGGDYMLQDFFVVVNDFSDDTLELDGEYYTVNDETQYFTIDDHGVVDTGDEDDIEEDCYIGAISDEDGNLLYVFVSSYMGNVVEGSYSFVDHYYTDYYDYVVMMDGTDVKDPGWLDYDVFYSYDIVDGYLFVRDEIFDTSDSYTDEVHSSVAFEEGYWVLYDGMLDMENEEGDYAFVDFISYVNSVDDEDIQLSGDYYLLTDDTQVFLVDSIGDVTLGDTDDIDADDYVGAISDKDGNLLYVFVLAYVPIP